MCEQTFNQGEKSWLRAVDATSTPSAMGYTDHYTQKSYFFKSSKNNKIPNKLLIKNCTAEINSVKSIYNGQSANSFYLLATFWKLK